MPGITLDAGGLIALDRSDRRVVALLARARETGARVTVPATALAQAIRRLIGRSDWRGYRQPTTDVVALDRVDATNVGRLLATSSTSDITDAHVVICARRSGQHVVTSDPGDLRVLDPEFSWSASEGRARSPVSPGQDAQSLRVIERRDLQPGRHIAGGGRTRKSPLFSHCAVTPSSLATWARATAPPTVVRRPPPARSPPSRRHGAPARCRTGPRPGPRRAGSPGAAAAFGPRQQGVAADEPAGLVEGHGEAQAGLRGLSVLSMSTPRSR